MNIVRMSERVILRRLDQDDTNTIHRLMNDIDVARMLVGIPYPITRKWAREWISDIDGAVIWGEAFNLAIVRKDDDALIGCVGLSLSKDHNSAELGYWIGRRYWGHGYATEAARRLVRFGFDEIDLNRIQSSVFVHNTASARVLQKLGMTYEATLRDHIFKWDHYEDLAYYAVLKSEFVP